MVKSKPIDLDKILAQYEYDAASPSGFKRRTGWRCGKTDAQYLREPAGAFVGSIDAGGYYTIWCKGVHYLSHRVVAKLFGILDEDDNTIDHIDGDIQNNLPSNLRCVPHNVNSRNRKMPSTNTSGFTGVSLNLQVKNGVEYSRWVAQWRDEEGRSKLKGFSVNKYGGDTARMLAEEWRKQMIDKRNAEGAAYSERHGETQ